MAGSPCAAFDDLKLSPRKYVVYFLRRSNNCMCGCGVCGGCISDIVFFSTVQDHLDNIEGCECKFCKYYTYYCNHYGYQLFRYEEDRRISGLRAYINRYNEQKNNGYVNI